MASLGPRRPTKLKRTGPASTSQFQLLGATILLQKSSNAPCFREWQSSGVDIDV